MKNEQENIRPTSGKFLKCYSCNAFPEQAGFTFLKRLGRGYCQDCLDKIIGGNEQKNIGHQGKENDFEPNINLTRPVSMINGDEKKEEVGADLLIAGGNGTKISHEPIVFNGKPPSVFDEPFPFSKDCPRGLMGSQGK